MIIDAELLDRASKIKEAGEAENILAAIDNAAEKNQLGAERAAELRTFVIEKAAALVSAFSRTASRSSTGTYDWSAAAEYIEAAITRYGSNRQLEKALQNYRNNWAADFHNNFAAAYNKKDFDKAAKILTEGLNIFPDNKQLLSDRNILEKIK
jgi:tetratricopeptide (TPR) repeat protein